MDAVTLAEGVAHLTAVDADLARIHAQFGPPPPWSRPEGFATLVILVLEQQVSLASAGAAYRRLVDHVGRTPRPEDLLALDDAELRTIGFSRQKAGYCRGIAQAVLDGRLDLSRVGQLDDDTARSHLTALRGIGPWTADCYLLSALGRHDVWPAADRALQVAIADVRGLDVVPDAVVSTQIAEAWRPWRAVAARLLWHHYLGGGPAPGVS